MRATWIRLAAVASALSIAACGSSSKPSRTAGKGFSQALQFANCMRSHGVPKFPDPSTGGGGIQIQITPSSGVNPQAPAFQSAQRSCRKLLPGGGPGSGPPSAQAKAQMLQVSECMRHHGISSFPDPTTGSTPSPGNGYSAVLGHDGVFLAIPSSINMRSPAFKQAAHACGFGPRGRAP